MNTKKKLATIFTTLLMILSFVAVLPSPVQAQPVAAVSILDMAMKDPGTNVVTPGPFTPGGNPPMNLVLTNINNASRMGNILITAVYLIDLGTGISVDSYTVGLTFDPAVLKVATGGVYPVGGPLELPQTIFEATGFVPTPGVYNNYAGYVANYTVTSTAGPIAVGVGGAKPLLYVIFVMNYWGKTNIDFTVTASPTQTTVSNLGVPHALVDLDGYYEFSVHNVVVSPGLSPYFADPPHSAGELITLTVSIKNTELIHSWEINMSYFPTVISVPSNLLVQEGPYFKVVFINNTFTATVDDTAGWIHVNCTALPGQNRTGDGLLMAIGAYLVNYGATPLIVTSFKAVDSYGNIIPNLELQHYLTDPSIAVQFEKMPVVALLYSGSPYIYWTSPTHSISETFTMQLMLPYATSQKVHSWKAGFRFNPKVLEVVSVTEGTFLSSKGATTWTPGSINNTKGEVTSFLCVGDPGVNATGPGILANIEFKVKDYGRSLITLTDATGDPTQVELKDLADKAIKTPSGLPVVSASFEFRSPATVAVNIASSRKERYNDNEIFTVQLMIDTAENISGWQSGFYFTKLFLNCTGVKYAGFFGAGSVNITVIDNTAGFVSVSQFLLGGKAKGTGTLVNITFQIISRNATYLDLVAKAGHPLQTLLGDPFGYTLPEVTIKESPWGHSGIVWNKGDVNSSGNQTSTDVTILNSLLTKLMLEIIDMDEALADRPFCDVNYSGTLTSTDVTVCESILTKIMLELPWP